MGPPSVATFTFPADTNNDLKITAAELPSGMPLLAQVTALRVDATCHVDIQDQGSGISYGMGTFSAGGVAMVTLNGLANQDNGSTPLQALITCMGPPQRTNDLATDTDAKLILNIDRIPPTCAITAPTVMVIGPNDDADTTKPGYQLRAIGTATGETTIELKLSGGSSNQTSMPQSMPPNDTLLFDFDIPTTGDTTYTITVVATDDFGNTCTANRTIEADFVAPVLTITSPSAANSPYSSFTIPVTLTATDVGNHVEGQNVICMDPLGGPGGTLKVVNGVASNPMGMFMPGMQTMTCTGDGHRGQHLHARHGDVHGQQQRLFVPDHFHEAGDEPCDIDAVERHRDEQRPRLHVPDADERRVRRQDDHPDAGSHDHRKRRGKRERHLHADRDVDGHEQHDGHLQGDHRRRDDVVGQPRHRRQPADSDDRDARERRDSERPAESPRRLRACSAR